MSVHYYSRDGNYSRSHSAAIAEDEGRRPLTRAIPEVRRLAAEGGVKITVAEARAALLETWDGEWHHVSKYANRVDYFDPAAAADRLLECRLSPAEQEALRLRREEEERREAEERRQAAALRAEHDRVISARHAAAEAVTHAGHLARERDAALGARNHLLDSAKQRAEVLAAERHVECRSRRAMRPLRNEALAAIRGSAEYLVADAKYQALRDAALAARERYNAYYEEAEVRDAAAASATG